MCDSNGLDNENRLFQALTQFMTLMGSPPSLSFLPEIRKEMTCIAHQTDFDAVIAFLTKSSEYLYKERLSQSQCNLPIEKLRNYVRENYSKEISLPDVASYMNMSKTTFHRFVKKETGMTWVNYLNNVRIGYAAQMLLLSDDPIVNIGYDCGFNTSNYFIEVFKKVKGMTPGEYRESKKRK